MRLVPLRALVLGSTLVLAPVQASAWERDLGARDSAWSVALDAAGDVVLAGTTRASGTADIEGLVLKLSGVDGRTVWRRTIVGSAGTGNLAAVAVDAAGDVFVTGVVRNADQDVVMAKLSGVDGQVLWRHDHDGSAPTEPGSYQRDLGIGVGVGPDGDPIFGADLYSWNEETNLLVVKYASATGAETWRDEVDGGIGGNDLLFGFTVASDGDAVLAGWLVRAGTLADFAVVRLAGADGAERWRYVVDGGVNGPSDAAYTVTLDPAGNVIAGGLTRHSGPADNDIVVAKVDGVTGGEIWRYVRPANGYAYATGIAADANGDVIYGGHDGLDRFVVEKLAGADGARVWGTTRRGRFPWGLAVDPEGNAVVAGEVGPPGQELGDPDAFGVIKLDAATGGEIWREVIGTIGGATGVAVDGAGRVVASGAVGRHPGAEGNSGFVLKIAAEVPGHTLHVIDDAAAPAKRGLKLQARVSGIAVAAAGGPADPTVGGATLEVYNPLTTELASASLPAERWVAVTSPNRGRAYRYKGAKTDACQKAEVVEGKITVTCKGAGLGFTLDEATQGTLAVRLTHGSSAAGVAYCATFGGLVQRDGGTGGTGKGVFKAKKASAGGSCPVP